MSKPIKFNHFMTSSIKHFISAIEFPAQAWATDNTGGNGAHRKEKQKYFLKIKWYPLTIKAYTTGFNFKNTMLTCTWLCNALEEVKCC